MEELLALALSSHGDKSDGQPSTGRATRAQNSAGQDKLPPRLRNKSVKDQSAKSSSVASPARSVSPTRMNVIRVPGSDKLLEARLTSALANRKFRQWCLYEFFCSTIDQDWFAQNDFQQCLNGLGMESVTHLTRPKWRYVRSVIGKPRRVSHAFFMEERTNLNAYRMTCRKSPEEKEEHKHAEDEEPSQSSKEEHVVTLIPVGSPVLCTSCSCSIVASHSLTSHSLRRRLQRFVARCHRSPALELLLRHQSEQRRGQVSRGHVGHGEYLLNIDWLAVLTAFSRTKKSTRPSANSKP